MDKESIIKTAPIIDGGMVGRERQVKETLIESIIGELDASETVSAAKVSRKLKSDHNISLNQTIIDGKLKSLEDDGRLEHNSDGKYKIINQPNLDDFGEVFEPIRNEFEEHLLSSDYDHEIDYNIDNFTDALESVFLTYYQRIISGSEDLTEYNTDPLSKVDMSDCIDEVKNRDSIRNPNVFEETAKDYIQEETDKLTEFFGTVYIGVVNQDLLQRAQHFDLSSVDNEKKILFLDTNVIIPLVCNTDPLNPLVSSVCTRSKELDYSLYYLPATAKEMDRVVRNTKQNLTSFRKQNNSDPFDNQFVKDYNRRTDIVNPRSYKKRIGNWREFVEDKHDIFEFDEEVPHDDVDKEVINGWIKELDNVDSDDSDDLKSETQIKHDTQLISSTLALRDSDGPTIGPFGISNNKSLLPINNIGKGSRWEHGVLIDPQGWMNYLITFTPAKFVDGSQKEVARSILSTAANFEQDYDLEDYLDLLVAKSNVSSENQSYLKNLILETPLSDQLEDAAREGDGQQIAEQGYEIISGIDKYIEKEKETNEKLKSAQESYNEEKQRRKEEVEKRKQLEKVVENVQGIELNIDMSQDVSVKVTQEVQNQFDEFVQDLDSTLAGGIKDSEIPSPPEDRSDPQQIREWLETVDTLLDSSKKVADEAKRLKPYAKGLLTMLAA
jgi:hypothetical protein